MVHKTEENLSKENNSEKKENICDFFQNKYSISTSELNRYICSDKYFVCCC